MLNPDNGWHAQLVKVVFVLKGPRGWVFLIVILFFLALIVSDDEDWIQQKYIHSTIVLKSPGLRPTVLRTSSVPTPSILRSLSCPPLTCRLTPPLNYSSYMFNGSGLRWLVTLACIVVRVCVSAYTNADKIYTIKIQLHNKYERVSILFFCFV